MVYDLATDSLRVTRYWSLDTRDLVRYPNPRDYADQFSDLLRVAVEDRVQDTPVGVLMSGGLDSSSIATVAADVLGRDAAARLRAFTFVYDSWSSDEERHYASLVATSIGIEAAQMAVDTYEPFGRWEGDGLPAEPTLEGLNVVMSDMLDVMAEHGGAALTGEGGDPMLLPSSLLAQAGSMPLLSLGADLWRACRWRQLPPLGIRSWIQRRFASRESIPEWLGRDLLSVFDAEARGREIQARRSISHGARHRAVTDVIDPWWTSTFESLDAGITCCPLELRYPFFDVRLASFMLRLPSFPWCLNKYVVRKAMTGRLPESVRTRPKTPLAASPVAPRAQWSAARAADLFSSTPGIERFVDVRRFGQTVRGESLLASESHSAWAAISLAMWLRCDAAKAAPVGTI
jgi:asparagine synthase (glutamine-hydrolysing)